MSSIPNPLKLANIANMSPATYAQQSPIANEPHRGAMTGRSAQPRFDLHSVDLNAWDDGDWAIPFFSVNQPDELDEPWPYRFQHSQDVWICASDGEWYPGRVVGRPKRGQTRYDEGLYWHVEFYMGRVKVRKWFAPLNGDIKPDIRHTHRLLTEAGWLESDSDGF